MRIVQLTAGTGSFYCGTCLRDNALVHALEALGHDVEMVPLYLPLKTETDDASARTPVFLGGINSWLQNRYTVFRKLPRVLDAAMSTRPILQLAARRAGMTEPSGLGDMTVAMLRAADGTQNKEVRRLTDWLAARPRPDAVVLSNALLAGLAGPLHAATGALVACTLQGEDTFLDALDEPYREIAWGELRRRAGDVHRFLAVSHYHAALMTQRMEIEPERDTVVHNGIPLGGHEPGELPPDPPAIGFLAHLCADKGLDTLVQAFVLLRERGGLDPAPVLRIAGAWTEMDREYVEGLRGRLREAGLQGACSIRPNISREEKLAFLQELTVLSVPATYGESFGLYVLEALASGVPVVQPECAAFPEILEATGGGRLCAPDDPAALADALEPLLRDRAASRALGLEGRARVLEGFGAERMAREVAQALASSAPPSRR